MTDGWGETTPTTGPQRAVEQASTLDVVESRATRRRVRIPTFVIGLVAVAVVGGLIGRGLLFGAGGAASPTDAVEQLADALAGEDLAGALAILAPDEVRDAADVYASTAVKLHQLGVTPQKKTLGGIDLDISGLQLRSTQLGPDVAKVEIVGGTAHWAVHRDELGPKLRDAEVGPGKLAGSKDLATLDHRDRDGSKHPAFLMVVRRDGGWYVSPFYSVAEAIVSTSGAHPGDFQPVRNGPAAPTPSAAVDRLIDAVNHHDVDAGIDSLDTQEWAVLHTYRAAIDAALGRDANDPDAFAVDHWATSTTDLGGDMAAVKVTSMTGHATTHDISDEEWDAFEQRLDASDDEADVPEPVGVPRRVEWSYAHG
jgi:hypothetical protein